MHGLCKHNSFAISIGLVNLAFPKFFFIHALPGRLLQPVGCRREDPRGRLPRVAVHPVVAVEPERQRVDVLDGPRSQPDAAARSSDRGAAQGCNRGVRCNRAQAPHPADVRRQDMDDLEKFTRFAQKLTEAIAEELEDTARMDDHMDSATKSGLALRRACDAAWHRP